MQPKLIILKNFKNNNLEQGSEATIPEPTKEPKFWFDIKPPIAIECIPNPKQAIISVNQQLQVQRNSHSISEFRKSNDQKA